MLSNLSEFIGVLVSSNRIKDRKYNGIYNEQKKYRGWQKIQVEKEDSDEEMEEPQKPETARRKVKTTITKTPKTPAPKSIKRLR